MKRLPKNHQYSRKVENIRSFNLLPLLYFRMARSLRLTEGWTLNTENAVQSRRTTVRLIGRVARKHLVDFRRRWEGSIQRDGATGRKDDSRSEITAARFESRQVNRLWRRGTRKSATSAPFMCGDLSRLQKQSDSHRAAKKLPTRPEHSPLSVPPQKHDDLAVSSPEKTGPPCGLSPCFKVGESCTSHLGKSIR